MSSTPLLQHARPVLRLLCGIQSCMQSLLMYECTDFAFLLHIDSQLASTEKGLAGVMRLHQDVKQYDEPTGWLFSDISDRVSRLVHGYAFQNYPVDDQDIARLTRLQTQLEDWCQKARSAHP